MLKSESYSVSQIFYAWQTWLYSKVWSSLYSFIVFIHRTSKFMICVLDALLNTIIYETLFIGYFCILSLWRIHFPFTLTFKNILYIRREAHLYCYQPQQTLVKYIPITIYKQIFKCFDESKNISQLTPPVVINMFNTLNINNK